MLEHYRRTFEVYGGKIINIVQHAGSTTTCPSRNEQPRGYKVQALIRACTTESDCWIPANICAFPPVNGNPGRIFPAWKKPGCVTENVQLFLYEIVALHLYTPCAKLRSAKAAIWWSFHMVYPGVQQYFCCFCQESSKAFAVTAIYHSKQA